MGGAISSRYRYMPQGGHGSDVPLLRHYGKYINCVERNVKKDINRVESNCKKNIICVKRNVKNDAACVEDDIPCVGEGVKRQEDNQGQQQCDRTSQIGCSVCFPKSLRLLLSYDRSARTIDLANPIDPHTISSVHSRSRCSRSSAIPSIDVMHKGFVT
jgi:hypothetical protein